MLPNRGETDTHRKSAPSRLADDTFAAQPVADLSKGPAAAPKTLQWGEQTVYLAEAFQHGSHGWVHAAIYDGRFYTAKQFRTGPRRRTDEIVHTGSTSVTREAIHVGLKDAGTFQLQQGDTTWLMIPGAPLAGDLLDVMAGVSSSPEDYAALSRTVARGALQASAEEERDGLCTGDPKQENFVAGLLDGALIVKIIDRGAELPTGAMRTKFEGTLEALPPEYLWLDACPAGRADVWAMGIVLLELLGNGSTPLSARGWCNGAALYKKGRPPSAQAAAVLFRRIGTEMNDWINAAVPSAAAPLLRKMLGTDGLRNADPRNLDAAFQRISMVEGLRLFDRARILKPGDRETALAAFRSSPTADARRQQLSGLETRYRTAQRRKLATRRGCAQMGRSTFAHSMSTGSIPMAY